MQPVSNFAVPDSSNLFLTDGGLETTLIFLKGIDLPCFAAFDLLKNEEGIEILRDYYRPYLNLAVEYQVNFILESPTWRANPDWVQKVGYQSEQMTEINEKAIRLMEDLREEYFSKIQTIWISGCIGPRGDGYLPTNRMPVEDAASYHSSQIDIFKQTGVDLITAITMNYVEEAMGIALASAKAELPCVISFTVETDGKLPSGMKLSEAIQTMDTELAQVPAYYMINCAHPDHFVPELVKGKNAPWTSRILGIRANASCKSHAELDESIELDRGNPVDLGKNYYKLKESFQQLAVFGGCCGTDHEHIREIIQNLSFKA